MTAKFLCAIFLLASFALPSVMADTRPPYGFEVPPPRVWITYNLGEPSGEVTQKQIANAIGMLVDRLDYDYKQYVEAYRNWQVGTVEVRLTVDKEGTITGADVLASDVNRQLEVMVTNDLQGYKLTTPAGKPFTVKLSLRFEAEELIIQEEYLLPDE